MAKQRIHLVGKGCSGRGVTLRDLEPREKDKALLMAAKTLGQEATRLELKLAADREGIKMMIQEVTKETSMKDDFRVDPKTKWVKITIQDLDEPNGALSYDKLFTPKDDGILSAIYYSNTDPTPDEVNAIVNKAIPLAE